MNLKSGFINILKPTSTTSSDVVVKIKKILGTKKVGHLGTLDPSASGVLPIAVGRATKFFEYFLGKDKIYVARVKFGIETDTLDSFGTITKIDNVTITSEKINGVLNNFVGEIFQTPPKFSAVKINGRKAYELARENANFEIKPRKINIFYIKLIKNCGKNDFLFEVHCSAGTYIRTLFSDIANKLETVATTTCIIRKKSGPFEICNSITLDEFEKTKTILKIDEVFSDFPVFTVDKKIAEKLINGVAVDVKQIGEILSEKFFIAHNENLIGFYEIENNKLKQIVYLFEGELWLNLGHQVFQMILLSSLTKQNTFQSG